MKYNGVDAYQCKTANLWEIVWEPAVLKESVLVSSTEVVSMILKIDEIIKI